jgi:hypothetical protein
MSTPNFSKHQRPKVTLVMPQSNFPHQTQDTSALSFPIQPSPYMLSANPSSIHNPFMQHLYNQKTSDFVSKHFEGLNKFTKSGLSLGERSVVLVYTKFRNWSQKWITHIFLFLIVLLYTLAGAFIFRAIEGNVFEFDFCLIFSFAFMTTFRLQIHQPWILKKICLT